MRTIVTIIAALSLLSLSARAQDAKAPESKKEAPKRISAQEAEKHFDETVTVTGKVAQVSIREKLVYVNLDKPFPASPLAAVIFARATNQFGDLKRLKGKDVEITGKITEFKDRAQIVLDSADQLKIVGKGPAAGESGTK